MKNLLRPALFVFALAPFLHARLEENLPATTYVVAKIENLPATKKNLDTNPLVAALKADRFSDFVKPLVGQFREKGALALFAPGAAANDDDKSSPDLIKDFDKVRDDVLGALNGEALFAVVKTPNPVPGHLPYDYVALADTSLDQDAIAALFKKLDIHQPVKPKKSFTPKSAGPDDEDETPAARLSPEIFAADEDYRGVTLHTLYIKEDDKPVTISGWAVVKGTLIFATAPNVLRDLVDSRQSGRKDGFADGALYRASADALKGTDVWTLADMPLVAGALHDLVAEKAADGDGVPGLDAVKAIDALGLDAFSRIRISATFAPDDTRFDSDIAWTEKRGLVKVLVEPMKNTPADLAVLPPDVTSASSARYDIAVFLKEFEALIHRAVPTFAPMLDMQIAKAKGEGLDIRGALLENFGDNIWAVTADPAAADGSGAAPGGNLVYAVTLRDPAKFESFVETALGKIAAEQTGDGAKSVFDEREFMGARIRTLKTGLPGMKFRYTVKGKTLFLSMGDDRLLDRTLAQYVEPKKSLADDTDVKAALAKLPPGGVGFSYIHLGRYAETIGKAMISGANSALAANGGKNAPKVVDETKAPRAADLPFIAVGNSVIGDNEITSRTIVIRTSDAGR